MRALVGGIGYRNLSDHSFGPMVVDALADRSWPVGVTIEDLSYGPIAVVQRLQDDPPEAPLDRAVIVAAVARTGREAGALTVYRWDRALPGPETIQTAVTEAVTGVIAMDNTLIVAEHFQAWPRDVIVVEAQPAVHESGEELSRDMADAFTCACHIVVAAATDPAFLNRVPMLPLGGGAPALVGTLGPTISHVRPRTR